MQGRGDGPLPHRHPRRARRLAGQAVAAVRARARGRRHRRRARPGRDRGRGRRPRRDAVARLRLRCLRPLRLGLGDALPRAEEHGLLDRRRRSASTPSAYGRYVVKVPAGIDPFDAAPLTCAGVTTYKAVKVAGTRSSDLVAVFGVGGLGHLAIQYAAIAGGRVIAVDIHDDKLDLARELGAEFTVNAPRRIRSRRSRSSAAPTRRSRSRSRRGRSSRPTARCGAAARSSSSRCRRTTRCRLPIFETVLNGITIVGSIVGTRADLRDVFALHARRQDASDPRDPLARRRQRGDRRRRGRPRRRTHRLRSPDPRRRHQLMATIEQIPSTIVDPAGAGIKSRYENFIGGDWVAPTTGEYRDNVTPATGEAVHAGARTPARPTSSSRSTPRTPPRTRGARRRRPSARACSTASPTRSRRTSRRSRSPRATTTASRSARRAPPTSRWPPTTSATSRR